MSRLELEGMLQRLRMRRLELATNADAKIKGIKHLLILSAITPINEIDIEGTHSLSVDLLAIKKEMIQNLEDKKKIEKELD